MISSDGCFSIKSSYTYITSGTNRQHKSLWNLIWKWQCPERINTLLWLLLKEKFLTNASKVVRHLATDDKCPSRMTKVEICIHPLEIVLQLKTFNFG